jgi:hypothetical protein
MVYSVDSTAKSKRKRKMRIVNRPETKDLNTKLFPLYQDERKEIDEMRRHIGGKRLTISSLFRMGMILLETRIIDLNMSHVILQSLEAPNPNQKCRNSAANDSPSLQATITGVYECDMRILERHLPGKDDAVQIRSLLYSLAEYLDHDLSGKIKRRAELRRGGGAKGKRAESLQYAAKV